jgi:hypothetical protein
VTVKLKAVPAVAEAGALTAKWVAAAALTAMVLLVPVITAMARKKLVSGSKKTKLIADQAIALADYATKALVAAEQLRITTKSVEGFPLQARERTTLARLPALPAKIKEKMAKKDSGFSIAEVASMGIAVADSLVEAEPRQQTCGQKGLMLAITARWDSRWINAATKVNRPCRPRDLPKIIGIKPPACDS